jgi:tellurite resistance protein
MSGPTLESLLAAVSPDPGVRAQTVAFALVAAHDTEVSDVEVGRYVEIVADEVTGPLAEVGARFTTLAEAMKADLAAASEFTRGVLGGVKDDAAVVKKVVRAARAAAVADVELDRREEWALTTIGDALGVDADL